MILSDENLNKIEVSPIMESLKILKIDDSEYFGDKFTQYISNSRLSLLNPAQENNPEAFFDGLSKHNKYSDSLIFGSAVHELVLQPELFELVTSVDRPTAKLGFIADYLYSDYVTENITESLIIKASNEIDYYKGKLNKERIDNIISLCTPYWSSRKSYEDSLSNTGLSQIYLDSKSRDRVLRCVNALNTNKAISDLLYPKGMFIDPIYGNEQAILLDLNIKIPGENSFIFKIKAKLDNYSIDTECNTVTVNDVKTIGKILPEFENNFSKFHYSRELAIYSWLLSLVASKYYNMSKCLVRSNCLVVSTIPNYYTKVYKVTKKDFIDGWNEFTYLIRLAAYYYNEGYRFL